MHAEISINVRSCLHPSLDVERYKPASFNNPVCRCFTALSGSADFLALAIMTQLLWPSRSRSYFQLDTPELDLSDELEQFSQATHVLNSDRAADQATDHSRDRTRDHAADQTRGHAGDQARDHTADQARDPPPWPLPDVTREAAREPVREPADSSVFSPVDVDTERLLPG